MKLTQNIKAIILAILVTIGISYVMADWTPAPANPPSSNTPAPINVGTSVQAKNGGLVLGSSNTTNNGFNLLVHGNAFADNIAANTGLFGAPTVTTNTVLDVYGKMKIRGGNPGAGKVLVSSDTNGSATWETISTSTSKPTISISCGVEQVDLTSAEGDYKCPWTAPVMCGLYRNTGGGTSRILCGKINVN